jgi:hypothetical protein|tara:strand:+ start:1336 stop:1521 length:186 start_codon:yes stop_codon:yes gene_type:complete
LHAQIEQVYSLRLETSEKNGEGTSKMLRVYSPNLTPGYPFRKISCKIIYLKAGGFPGMHCA